MPDTLSPTLTDHQTCPAIGYQSASICVPVTVTPFAQAGATFTKCCGNPVVVPGKNTCNGTKNGACVFTINQDICVAVPIDFGAVATVGDTFVNCNNASAENDCANCNAIPILPDTPVTPIVPPKGT